ncbi:MAG: type III pantothenate kinase [Bacteroidetes bacterium SW_9_63_38]|nr:MAG: type III pantothenate kinase [Bacteroidetes bacterium SW_9_63_38]
MFLAVDIGNSAVKGGVFDGATLEQVFSVASAAEATWPEALAPHLSDVSVDGVGIASVVPATTEAVTAALEARTDATPVHVRPAMPLPFRLDYETPDTLGMDRLAAAAAGWTQHGRRADPARSVVVVDAGTAVTGEVVHRDGVYRGGVIAAGPALVRQALRGGTAQLPDVDLELPDDPVGRSTQSAIQSGIMWGLVDLVRGMTERLANRLPDSPVLVLTGGWSALLADHLEAVDAVSPHLVLEGVHTLTADDDIGSM